MSTPLQQEILFWHVDEKLGFTAPARTCSPSSLVDDPTFRGELNSPVRSMSFCTHLQLLRLSSAPHIELRAYLFPVAYIAFLALVLRSNYSIARQW